FFRRKFFESLAFLEEGAHFRADGVEGLSVQPGGRFGFVLFFVHDPGWRVKAPANARSIRERRFMTWMVSGLNRTLGRLRLPVAMNFRPRPALWPRRVSPRFGSCRSGRSRPFFLAGKFRS